MTAAEAQAQALVPAADAHTNSSRPTKNFGTATTLLIRQTAKASEPTHHALLRFQLGTPAGAAATLRLWVVDPSSDGGTLYLTDSTWSETGVTWANEPLPAATIGQFGPVAKGRWVEIRVDAAHLTGEQVSFLIVSSSDDRAAYASREASNAPQLVVDATASPTATPSPSPTATPSPSPTPSPAATPTPLPETPSPTASPSPAETPASSPAETPAPESTPSPRAETAGVVGYGSATIGGQGGRVIEVRSVKELSTALNEQGPREIQLVGSGEWHAMGEKLRITTPFVTVDGSRCTCYIRDGWILVKASEVILRDLRIRTGDESVSANDADPISVNGGTGAGISNIVIDHVEAIWGPDVGGITLLNNVRDATIQNSIIGEGLFRSRHAEGHEDADGHSYALNVTGADPDIAPSRVTIIRNLITSSEGRNPRICGASAVDLVNNVIYNHRDGPQCNPRSLNMVGNLLIQGPAPAQVGLSLSTAEFRHTTSAQYPIAFLDAIYLSGNHADGYALSGYEGPPSVLRALPAMPLSVAARSVDGLLDLVLEMVGPSTRDAETLRIIDNVRNRTGFYVSGDGLYPPR